jgi:3-deoxy-D-manno-octulosonic acid kinase
LHSQFKIKKTGDSYILYDAGIIAEPTVALFDRDYHTNQDAQQKKSPGQASSGIGRAKVVYFSLDGKNLAGKTLAGKTLVLKHYYRGGAVATFLKDRYLGVAMEKSRAFKEFRLLKKMRQLDLPVPQAVAAHVEGGLLFYRADLITEKVEHTKTLAEVLTEKPMPAERWEKIGACIKLFHQHDIYHADLNARNILLSDTAEVYLIDFDNSYFRVNSISWKMANLARLKRSLLKFKKNEKTFHFAEEDWTALVHGYNR